MDDSRDVITGHGSADDAQEPDSPVAEVVASVKAPETLALASLLLAVISLLGLGLLNGSPYVPELYSDTGMDTTRATVAARVGAGFALLPAALGAVALRRLPEQSSFRVLAGTGILLAAVAVLLRLAVAVRTATQEGVQYIQF